MKKIDKILNYQSEYTEGLTSAEIDKICQMYGVDRHEFSEKLGVVTGVLVDMNFLIYHHDVELGIRLCLEKRNMNEHEWD